MDPPQPQHSAHASPVSVLQAASPPVVSAGADAPQPQRQPHVHSPAQTHALPLPRPPALPPAASVAATDDARRPPPLLPLPPPPPPHFAKPLSAPAFPAAVDRPLSADFFPFAKKHKRHKLSSGRRNSSSSLSLSTSNDFFSSDAPIQLSSTAKHRKDSVLSASSASSTISISPLAESQKPISVPPTTSYPNSSASSSSLTKASASNVFLPNPLSATQTQIDKSSSSKSPQPHSLKDTSAVSVLSLKAKDPSPSAVVPVQQPSPTLNTNETDTATVSDAAPILENGSVNCSNPLVSGRILSDGEKFIENSHQKQRVTTQAADGGASVQSTASATLSHSTEVENHEKKLGKPELAQPSAKSTSENGANEQKPSSSTQKINDLKDSPTDFGKPSSISTKPLISSSPIADVYNTEAAKNTSTPLKTSKEPSVKRPAKVKAEVEPATNGSATVGETNRDIRSSKDSGEKATAKSVEALKRDRSKRGSRVKLKEGEFIMIANKAVPLTAINNTDRSGRTPLFKVSGSGDMEAVSALIRAGADVNTKDYAGWSPLHEACIEGQLKVCNLLITYGADVNALGFDNQTPLHDAVGNNHYDVVELLLSHGASLVSANKAGKTPMDEAEDETMVQLLQMWKRMMAKVVEVDESGLTLLHTYAIKGDLKGVKRVLKYGAEVDFPCNAGWTPLHEAASKGFTAIVEELCRYGAAINAPASTGSGDTLISGVTPLMDAAAGGFLDAARLLLEFGADPDATDSSGRKAVDYVSNASTDVLRELVEILRRPASCWKPTRTPDFIKSKPGCVGMMTHIRDQASARLEKSESSVNVSVKDAVLKPARKNSISSDTSHSTNLNGSLGSRGVGIPVISAATAAAVGLGGPNAFSWGGLDARDREGQFESAREERKFRKLLQTLEAQAGGDTSGVPVETEGAAADAAAPTTAASAAAVVGAPVRSRTGPKPKRRDDREESGTPKKSKKSGVDSDGSENDSGKKSVTEKRRRSSSAGVPNGSDRGNSVDEEAGDQKKRVKPQANDGDAVSIISENDVSSKRAHESDDDETRKVKLVAKKKSKVELDQKFSKKLPSATSEKPTAKDKLSGMFDDDKTANSSGKKEQTAMTKKDSKLVASKSVVPAPKATDHPKPQLPFVGTVPKKPGIINSVTSALNTQTAAPVVSNGDLSAVKKKPKKKNLFGISGYQRAGNDPPTAPPAPSAVVEQSQHSQHPQNPQVAVADAVARTTEVVHSKSQVPNVTNNSPPEPSQPLLEAAVAAELPRANYRRKCLPIYQVYLEPQQQQQQPQQLQNQQQQLTATLAHHPKKAFRASAPSATSAASSTVTSSESEITGAKPYFVDLQIACYLGKQSGREVLEMFPGIAARVATRAQKELLSASPVGEACLRALIERQRARLAGAADGVALDDAAVLAKSRWLQWYERGGARAMRMEEVDVQFLAAEDVLREIRAVRTAEGVVGDADDFEVLDLDLDKYGAVASMGSENRGAKTGIDVGVATAGGVGAKFKKFGAVDKRA